MCRIFMKRSHFVGNEITIYFKEEGEENDDSH